MLKSFIIVFIALSLFGCGGSEEGRGSADTSSDTSGNTSSNTDTNTDTDTDTTDSEEPLLLTGTKDMTTERFECDAGGSRINISCSDSIMAVLKDQFNVDQAILRYPTSVSDRWVTVELKSERYFFEVSTDGSWQIKIENCREINIQANMTHSKGRIALKTEDYYEEIILRR